MGIFKSLIRESLCKMNLVPLPIYDAYYALMRAKAITAASKIGIFNLLDARIMPANNIASELGLDYEAARIMLDYLAKCGYLRKRGNAYTNSRMAQKWLAASSPKSIGRLIASGDDVYERWQNFSQVMIIGKPVINLYDYLAAKPDALADYQLALKEVASLSMNRLIKLIKIAPDARRVLDLGGGHGIAVAELCKKNAHLTGVVFDYPQAKPICDLTINSYNLEKRLVFQAGNFIEDSLGEKYDVILIFNVLQELKRFQAQDLLSKAYGALNKQGMIVIGDLFNRENLNEMEIMLKITNLIDVGGTVYTMDELRDMLKEAGFSRFDSRINMLLWAQK